MNDPRPSPFTSLDKALLRSTTPRRDDTASTAPARAIEEIAPHQAAESDQPAAPSAARRRRSGPPVKRADEPASDTASVLASYPDELIERLRRIVKGPGREVSFIRLSAEEKMALGDLVYQFKRNGRKTTETEISRIAVNFILADHAANGDESVLARVLAALLA
jgi:hypothetical protein